MTGPQQTGRSTSRRAVVAAAGAAGLAAALAACGGGSESDSEEPGQDTSKKTSKPGKGSGGDGAAGDSGGEALGSTGDIPEGGGKVFADQKVVVTQPKAGEFKAFSAICTHSGCPVRTVANGTINCPCHGSKYDITDGSVQGGPAPRPLAPRKVVVDGDSIKLA